MAGFVHSEISLSCVLGILVAFSLDAWWSHRADQAQERLILEGLYAEFSANLETLEATMTEHRRTLDSSRQLLHCQSLNRSCL